MSELEVSDLFAEGTAPQDDPAFAREVAAKIGRARLGLGLGGLALRTAAVMAASGAVFVGARALRPVLAPVVEASPQVMGVPAPLVLAVVAAGLALGVRRYVLSLSREPSPGL